jgi:hypothetical protein
MGSTVDTHGNIYVSDFNDRIRRFAMFVGGG